MNLIFNCIRSLLHMMFMIVTVVPWATVSVLLSIFLRGTPYYWFTTFWLKMATWGAKVICGIRYEIRGWEHLPKPEDNRPTILLSKHQSTWETFAYPALMPHPLSYVFKRELIYIPFFGWAMARLDMIHINRSKRAEAFGLITAQGKKFMAQGNWIIMFPEGTRIPVGQAGTYKTGGSRLAIATGAWVIPIAHNAGEVWPRKAFIKRPGLVTISIGAPIAPAGHTPESLMQQVEKWIETEMRTLAPHRYNSTYVSKTRAGRQS
jgi:1-acyl-sn-glycerol-3-phosphate acyltransferase